MAHRPSLAVAVVTFSAAVIVLAADTAWGVDVTLEWQDADGAWRALGSDDAFRPPEPAGSPGAVRVPVNGTVVFRLVVENDRPVALTDRAVVTWQSFGPEGSRSVTPVDERLDVDAFSARSLTFVLAQGDMMPAGTARAAEEDPKPVFERRGSVDVRVGDRVSTHWVPVQVVASS